MQFRVVRLTGKIKYSERREAPTKKPGPKPRSAKPAASAAGQTHAAGGTKAEAIRAVAKSLPKPFRPLDVRAELAKQGIDASTTFIGKVLRAAGMKRKRRSKAAAGSAAPAVAATSAPISIDDLVAAKKVVGQVGSIEKVREALAALARLG